MAGEYPEEVAEIYETYIMSAAKESSNRAQYRELCDIIRGSLKALGKEKTAALIARLEDKYTRRPAMLDELRQLKREADLA